MHNKNKILFGLEGLGTVKMLGEGKIEPAPEAGGGGSAFLDDGEMSNTFFSNRQFIINLDADRRVANVYIFGQIWLLNCYSKLISFLNSVNKEWTVFINIFSPGGIVSSGFNIAQAIADCKANVITRNIGQAASMGSALLVTGKKIDVLDPSITMFHMSLSGGYCNSMVMESRAKNVNRYIKFFFQKFVVDRGILTQEEVTNITDNEGDMYIPAKDFRARLKSANLLYEGD